MPARVVGPSPLQQRVRGALVVGYLGLIALGLTTGIQPRLRISA